MMTVNNMAKYSMMTDKIGGLNPILGNQNVSAPKTPAAQTDFGAGLQAGRNNAYSTTAAVRSSGKDLLGAVQDSKTALSQLQGKSSDTDVASVTVDKTKAAQTSLSDMGSDPLKLDVKQTALSQTNAGEAMGAKESAVAAGEYSFAIEAGGKTHNFTISVDEKDTNASIQEKMAQAINKSDVGVTASVTSDDKKGTTSLSLTSDSTGTDAAFTVKDVEGDLTSAMGVKDATQKAQNAVYSVNGGEEKTSQSNDITIATGVTATLKESGTTSISSERDTKSAMEGITELVDSINAALKSANEGDGRGSSRLANDIRTMNNSYADSLARVGISVSSNGELSIDEKKLEQAAKDGSLDRFFSDQRYGFNARAERIASNAANTEYYADKQLGFSFDSFSFNQNQLKFFNMHNAGLLFNMLI